MAIAVRQWAQTADWTTDATSKTITVSFEAGDVIVFASAVASGNVSVGAPTATGLTFTQRQFLDLSAGECEVAIYTAKAAAQGTNVVITATYDVGGSDGWGACAWVLSGADDYVDGFVNANESATNHTVAAGSALCYIVADWSANASGDGTLTMTTGSGTATERRDDGTTTTMNNLCGEWIGTAAGTFAFGLTNYAPGGNALAVVQAGVEILAAAGGPTAPPAPTGLVGTPLNGGAELWWVTGGDGGSTILYHEVDWATAAAPTTWLGPVSTGSAGLVYDKTGLTNATGYVFRVRAVNAIGAGAWSTTSATITPTDLPVVVHSATAAISASRSPSVTFQYRPRADDVVVLFPSSTTTAITYTIPSGWENPLGGTTDVESDAHQLGVVAHRVTAGEASGNTTIYTATNLAGAAFTGNVIGVAVRNVDPTTMLDVAGSTFNSGNTITPHVLAATAAAVATDSIILRCVTKDGTGTYTTPAGHTQVATSNANQGKWLGTRDTRTTSGATIAAVNITPNAGDEYASITVALRKAPLVGVTGSISQSLGALTGAASGEVTVSGSITQSLGALTGSATGERTVTGAVSQSLGALTGTAAGSRERTGFITQSLGALTGSAQGFRTQNGSITQSLGALTGTASGQVTVSGSVSQSLGALTGTASGVVTVSGSIAQSLGALTGSAVGTVTVTGSVSQSLGALTGAASGTRTVSGAVVQSLGALSGAASGARTVSGAISQSLGALTGSASGTATTDKLGSISQSLGPLTGAASGQVSRTGSVAQSLGALTGQAVGVRTVAGSATVSLGALTGTAVGVRTVTGTITSILGPLSGSSVGVRTVLGSIAQSLGGSGSASGSTVGELTPGTIETVIRRHRVSVTAAPHSVEVTGVAHTGEVTTP